MAEKVVFGLTHVTRLVPFLVWQVASLAVLIIIMCMLAMRIHYGAHKKRIYSISCVALLLMSIVALEYYERSQEWYVISKENVPVYMGPDKKYPYISSLHMHNEVRIIQNKGAWLQIEDNGRKGWIENETNSEHTTFDKA